MTSKRKVSEVWDDLQTDAAESLEERLNAEFDRAHGAKAAELEKAHEDARAALAVLERCGNLANQPHAGVIDEAELQRIYTAFDQLYPPVEAPSMAFKIRHPGLFGRTDHRSEAAKRKDEAFRARDAPTVAAFEARTNALACLNTRIHGRKGAFNDAVSFLNGLQYRRYQSDERTRMISIREHK